MFDINGLSNYSNSGLQDSNGVPNINLRDLILSDEKVINWNSQRKQLSREKFLKVVGFVISKFNSLIDFVIENDIKTPTDKFRSKFLEIISDSSGRIYDYCVYTLMLPALINFLAAKRKAPSDNAHFAMGYIPADVDFFPLKQNEKWASVIKITDSEKSVKLNEIVDIPYKLNNFKHSKYSFPFAKSIIKTNLALTSCPLVDCLEEMKQSIIFSEDIFSQTNLETNIEYGKTYSTTVIEDTINYRDLSSPDWKQGEDLKVYSCKETDNTCNSYKNVQVCTEKNIFGDCKKFDYIQTCANKSSPVVQSEISVATQKLITEKILDDDLLPAEYLGVRSDYSYTLNEAPTSRGTIALGNQYCVSHPDSIGNVQRIVQDAKRKTRRTEIKSSSGASRVIDPSSIEDFKRRSDFINCYRTLFALYYISDDTLKFWLYFIKRRSNLRLILDEIRMIVSSPEVILSYHARKKYQNSSIQNCFYVNLPLGAFCLRPSNQYILPNKNYFADYYRKDVVENRSFESSLPHFNSVFTSEMNSIDSAYISNVYKGIIQMSKVSGSDFENVAFVIDIPGHGYQLFDIVDTNAQSYLGKTDLVHVVRQSETVEENQHSLFSQLLPRIVVSFKLLSGTLNNSYQKIAEVNIPLFIVEKTSSEYFDVSFNSVDTDLNSELSIPSNKAYIYISQSNQGGLDVNYLASQHSNTKDDNNRSLPYLTLEFNASESSSLPIVIEKRNLD
jgi:hypothetical protein